MSNNRLAKLRELLKKEKTGKGNNNGGRRADFYPFWLMPADKKAVVRILPDLNPDNPKLFYVDKLEHRLSINGKDRTIPCPKSHDETAKCPICELSAQYYKAEGKGSKNGKYYYRNRTSLVRLLVLSDPLPADESGETAEGKVLNSQFSYQLMEKIKAQLSSDELDDDLDVFDLDRGLNFNIIKSLKPGTEYADYGIASEFSRKITAIPAEYRDSVELIDLSTLLPENPGYDAVKRLLDAHLNGSDEAEGDEDGDEGEDESMRALMERRKAKAAASKAAASEDDEEEETPPPSKTTSKKPVIVEEDDDEEETPPPSKTTSKKSAPVVEEEDDDADLEEMMRQIKERRAAANKAK